MGRSRTGRRSAQADYAEPAVDEASSSAPHQAFLMQLRACNLWQQQQAHVGEQQAEQQSVQQQELAAMSPSSEAQAWVDAVPVPLSGRLGLLLARGVASLQPLTPEQPNSFWFLAFLACLLTLPLEHLFDPQSAGSGAPGMPVVWLLLSQLLCVMWSMAVKWCVEITSSIGSCRSVAESRHVTGTPQVEQATAAMLSACLKVFGRCSLTIVFGAWQSMSWLLWLVLLSLTTAECAGILQPLPEGVWYGLYTAHAVCCALAVWWGPQSADEQWHKCTHYIFHTLPYGDGRLPPHVVFDSLDAAGRALAFFVSCCRTGFHWMGVLWAWVALAAVALSRLLSHLAGLLLVSHLITLPWQYSFILRHWQNPSVRGWPLSELEQHLVLGATQFVTLQVLMLLWHCAWRQQPDAGEPDSSSGSFDWTLAALLCVWFVLGANHAVWVLANKPALYIPSAKAAYSARDIIIPRVVGRMALGWHYLFACIYMGIGAQWLADMVSSLSSALFFVDWDASHWPVRKWATVWTCLSPFTSMWLVAVSAGLQHLVPAYIKLRLLSLEYVSVEQRRVLAACVHSLMAAIYIVLHVWLRPAVFLHCTRCMLHPLWSLGTCLWCVLRPINSLRTGLWRMGLLMTAPVWKAWLTASSGVHCVLDYLLARSVYPLLNYIFPRGPQAAPIVLASSCTAPAYSGPPAASSGTAHSAPRCVSVCDAASGPDTPLGDPACLKDATAAKADQEARQCTVCFDAARSVAFKPCGHVCCCLGCWNTLRQRSGGKKRGGQLPNCPLCHTEVREFWSGIIVA